jgi:MarR family transcriptional regulator, lower aerobic nicotinate degradation pathway regulator
LANGHDIAMGLRAAYWSMHRQTDACLEKCGMTANQFVLLALLVEQDGITQQELAQRASSDPNTIRAMLVLMENNGIVAREQHPTDGRARRVNLTRKGRQTFEKLSAVIKPLQERLSSLFQAGEDKTLVSFFNRISEDMTQLEHDSDQLRSKISTHTVNR